MKVAVFIGGNSEKFLLEGYSSRRSHTSKADCGNLSRDLYPTNAATPSLLARVDAADTMQDGQFVLRSDWTSLERLHESFVGKMSLKGK